MDHQPDSEEIKLSKKRSWAMYSPATPSPLNPSCNSHGEETPERGRTRNPSPSPSRPTTPGREGERHRPMRVAISPTEMLLRQKAAQAWQSIRRAGGRMTQLDEQEWLDVGEVEKTPIEQNSGSPIHPAHWEDQEDQFFVNTQDEDGSDSGGGGDDDDHDDDDVWSRWTIITLEDITTAWPFTCFKVPMTRRSLFVAMLCLGGCIPAVAILSSNGPSASISCVIYRRGCGLPSGAQN
ncbi:hypothetical protein SODALDRAFT_333287 [Sodiomyces alkalinus F11]|uniref:Uncharacterized protein n=1 Tax=Sodiomyces alkalinus (strain CBS 110278 / VKM F-3762 / F11) TaxID=1314773 RepID=A0A3N2PVY2_SODAK|nr:hypothetical protein SODALDRAFT_333287 [Sodiomyces alkalinus F11]ROT38670.1 hypothetical protein SODALDRAFT_333287 [Sodiomyces alkalinus F11]